MGTRGGGALRRGAMAQVDNMRVFLPDNPHAHFSYLSLNIQQMFLTGKPQYPVERTLLISGALEALIDSRCQGYRRVETPHLNVSYRSYEEMPIRPCESRSGGRESGAV